MTTIKVVAIFGNTIRSRGHL